MKTAQTTPDFTQLPDWVRWLAQDADGSWWGYEHEPNEGDSGWYENEVGASIKLLDAQHNPRWRHTLRRARG